MIKTDRISILFSTLRQFGLLFVCLLTAGVASATIPDIHGRWEFAITTGDTSLQLADMGQSTFSTYLLQSGTALTNIPQFTTDTVACDTQSNNNVTVSNSSIDASGNVVVDFTVALDGQSPFHYVFTGVLAVGPPTVIVGTYQRTASGCTQGNLGTGTKDGDFTATWFPDLAGTWVGAFDSPDVGAALAPVPATFVLTTNPDKTLSGTVSAPTLVDASSNVCLSSTVHLQSNMVEGVSQSAGVYFELFGTTDDGLTRVWVNATATNPDGSTAAVGEDNPAHVSPLSGTSNDGTNNSYTALYGITGGPCDGLGGGDAPFMLVKKQKGPSKRQDGLHGHDNNPQHSRGR